MLVSAHLTEIWVKSGENPILSMLSQLFPAQSVGCSGHRSMVNLKSSAGLWALVMTGCGSSFVGPYAASQDDAGTDAGAARDVIVSEDSCRGSAGGSAWAAWPVPDPGAPSYDTSTSD